MPRSILETIDAAQFEGGMAEADTQVNVSSAVIYAVIVS